MNASIPIEIDHAALMNASPNAYLLLTPDLTMIAANAAFERMVDRPFSTLEGRYLFDALPARERDSVKVIRASLAHVLDSRKPHCIPLLHYPVETEHGWEDRHWSISNTPLLDDKGNVVFILNHVLDVTELLNNNAGSDTALSPPDYRKEHFTQRINEALDTERRRMRQLMEQAPGFVAVARGPQFVFELANNAYYQLVGHREILGKPVREALPELEGQGFYELLEQVFATGEPFIGRAMRIHFQHEPGAELTERYIDFVYQPILENDGSVSGIFVQGHDVTEAHELSKEIGYQAAHDSLTGLINRREFERCLNAAISTLGDTTVHSLLYMDLDQFKIVNDTCGHSAGDELLRHIGTLLRAEVRPTDTLARLGGDEFALLLENCPGSTAERIANTLRERIGEIDFAWQQRIFGCSVSIGVTTFDNASGRIETILSAADAACFLAKEKGRNRVQVYRPEDDELTARRREMDWVSRLREALQEKRIVLYAQRIEPLSKQPHDRDHLEVLIRLRETDGTIVPPMAFIPAAERYGLMQTVDRYVIREVFNHLAQLPVHERERRKIAINLSGVTLNDSDFLPYVEAQLNETGISANQVSFEITETTAVANFSHTSVVIRNLKVLGFEFALDDFGSGMSSFSYLKNLPVDRLKIDGVFIKHIVEDSIDAAMVRAIAEVAQVMGLETVAEYVENENVCALLAELGVDFAQGFGVHKPEPLQDIRFPK